MRSRLDFTVASDLELLKTRGAVHFFDRSDQSPYLQKWDNALCANSWIVLLY